MEDTTLSLSTLLAGSRDPDWQVEVLRHALHTYLKRTMAYLSSYIWFKTERMEGGVDSTPHPLQCHGMPTTE